MAWPAADVLAVLGLLACGVVAGRTRAVPEGTAAVLDRLIIVLALPGLVLARVPNLELDATTLVPVGVAWGQLLFLVAVVLLLSRAMGWSRLTTGTMLLCVPLGNTSFLGVPAVEALLGSEHVPYAIIYDQLGSFLALSTWGALVAARYGGGARPTVTTVLRRIATFPPFVAIVVAVVVRFTGLPATIEDVAELLGATLTPLAMLAIGLRLGVPPRSRTGPLVTGLVLRMAVAPAAVFGVAALVGGGGVAWDTSLLEAAMPPMVTAGIVAADAGLDDQLATALVGGGILLALVSLPVVAAIL